jgi:glycosyltransferase involved in cell wall biosynthesis
MSEVLLSLTTDKTVFTAVSIGMPIFNGEKYIREALESLLSQSHTNFELIISDNASTDKTEEICIQYAASDPRIRYVRQPENIGVDANFRFVLDEARGEYFMWAAADDVWDVTWIKDLLDSMKKTGAEAAFGTIQCIDEHSLKLKHIANNTTFDYRGPQWYRQLKYFLQFEGGGKANPIYGLWRTSDLRRIYLKNHLYDYLLVFDLLSKTELAGCSNSNIYKRIHSDCVGGDVMPIDYNKNLVATVRLVWKHLFNPISIGLISQYIKSFNGNRFAIMMAIPFKYFVAYLFIISNSRLSFRKAK